MGELKYLSEKFVIFISNSDSSNFLIFSELDSFDSSK